VTRAGADDELGWVLLDQFVHSNLVISEDVDCSPFQDKVLVNVPGK
jgi:hypothetical protein